MTDLIKRLEEAPEHITVCDGKYTIVIEPGGKVSHALRHGQPWPAGETLNNLEHALACELRDLRAEAILKATDTGRE
jgi:hypothetical protein